MAKRTFIFIFFLAATTAIAAAGEETSFTGDQASGIGVVAPPAFVNVFDLSADIAPDSGVPGISLSGTGGGGAPGEPGAARGDKGEKGGDGPALMTSFSGNGWKIVTRGDNAHGILSESFAGKGGPGGDSPGQVVWYGPYGVPGRLGYGGVGGDGGEGGRGGDVTVDHSGAIESGGKNAHGIYAFSRGGAGGSGGDGDSPDRFFRGTGGRGGDGGGGGRVAVTTDSDSVITTSGEAAHGIMAVSSGGPAGAGGSGGVDGRSGRRGAPGSGGAVEIIHAGDIAASGTDAVGILARSGGAGRGGNIRIDIDGGSVAGGSGGGAGIRMEYGGDNRITNRGRIQAASGLAVDGGAGSDRIDNYGIIEGSVKLGSGSNRFNNHEDAVFHPGDAIALGSGNTLYNAGVLLPGGPDAPATTTLSGNLAQASSGAFHAAVNTGGEHDRLIVSGGSASLDGTLRIDREPGLYHDGTTHDILRVRQGGGITGSFSEIIVPVPRPLIRFDVNQADDAVVVTIDAPSNTTVATNRVETATAEHLDRIAPAASGDLFDVLGEFQALPLPAFESAFAGLNPQAYDNYTRTAYRMGREYSQTLRHRMRSVRKTHLHAPVPPHDRPRLNFDGPETDIDRLYSESPPILMPLQGMEGFWFNTYGLWGNQESRDGYTGFDYHARGGMLGLDALQENYLLGLAAGISRAELDLDRHREDGRIRNFSIASYGSYFRGGYFLDGAVSYGRNRYKVDRHAVVGPVSRGIQGKYYGNLLTTHLGGGRTFDLGGWKVEPFGSARYSHLEEDGFTETGGGSINLVVEERSAEELVSELGVRFFRAWEVRQGYLIPELSIAWSYDFELDDRKIRASYAGSPGESFSIPGQDAERHGTAVVAGVSYGPQRGLSTSLHYRGEYRDDYTSHGIAGELRFRF